MKAKYFFKLLALAIVVQCMGCSKFLEVDPPKTALVASEAFKTSESATAAVTGIYDQMKSLSESPAGYAATLYPGLSADELVNFNANPDVEQFAANRLNPLNAIVSNIWNSSYKMIGQANSVITGLTQSTTLPPALKSQLLGEAKISRALIYFYLLNLYGDVPLVLTNDWKATQTISRSSQGEVYSQVIKDLTEAATETSAAYPTAEKVRPNKFAALALLARVYLYTKDYKNAEAAASQVIESGVYGPLPDLDDVFLANSTEAIWQLAPTTGVGYVTFEANVFIPGSSTGPPDYYFSDKLINAFEEGDKRKDHWMQRRDYLGTTYYYPFKYKILSASGGYGEYYTILRLAETYLTRAEARAQNDNLSGALEDLNLLRDRSRAEATASVPNPLPALSSALSKPAVLIAVEQERRTELFAEWGHRWFDLKRTGKANAILSPEKPNWSVNGQLYPIPQSEILLDNKLAQNPGY
ncbi:RagB/SusD family nutrient uptake outer membrane protein [Pedobacter sp. AW31-3R]|uniref:RagB/SusD family nutrient uptake outer membrane protein n=1 Tax=Pedobacter sp. AW31-3R TaxID=3445781 RepID=UPI003FA008A8